MALWTEKNLLRIISNLLVLKLRTWPNCDEISKEYFLCIPRESLIYLYMNIYTHVCAYMYVYILNGSEEETLLCILIILNLAMCK